MKKLSQMAAGLIPRWGNSKNRADVGVLEQLLYLFGGKVKRDGLLWPEAYHQRYRDKEYKNRPFFQWWYFTVKDYEKNRHFALHLNPVQAGAHPQRTGVYVMFSMVETKNKTRFQQYEKYSFEPFSYNNNELKIFSDADSSSPTYRFKFNPEGYHIQLQGKMVSTKHSWYFDGEDRGQELESPLEVQWDLSFERIFGWFGQSDFEEIFTKSGSTTWNTYAHTAFVSGSIQIKDPTDSKPRKYPITRSPRFRGYCDMDWGVEFPGGNPSLAYPWGWYYFGSPSPHAQEEFAIIAGSGRNFENGSPSEGKFADINLSPQKRFSLRTIELFKRIKRDKQGNYDATQGLRIVKRPSSREFVDFDIKKNQWVDYQDKFGQARIPLQQTVTLESDQYKIIMDYSSEKSNYNRLLFPHKDYIFSDFEGLGVRCVVRVFRKIKRCFGVEYRLERVLENNNAGLEFGYNAPHRPALNLFFP